MTVTMNLPAGALDQIGFATSPLWEAALSLHVLREPKRHALLLPWVRRCRHLPEDLRADLRALWFGWDRWIAGIFELGLSSPQASFEEELAAIARVEPARILRELALGPALEAGDRLDSWQTDVDVTEPVVRDAVLAAADAENEASAALLRRAYDDPTVLTEVLVRTLQRYWEEAFAEEWERIRPGIEREIDRGARVLATRGVGAVFTGVLPEVRVLDEGRTLRVDKSCSVGEVDVAERGGLLLVPSVYSWPKVVLELDEQWPLLISYPIAELQQPGAHLERPEVVDTLRALADDTRLSIVKLVGEQARSTKELAGLLQLSEPAVSRHLKQLATVEILRSRRDGYYVLYELDKERLSAVGPSMAATIGIELDTPSVPSVDGPSRPVVLAREG